MRASIIRIALTCLFVINAFVTSSAQGIIGSWSGNFMDQFRVNIVFDSSNVAPTDNLITGVQIFNNAENGIAFLGGFDNQVSDCLIYGNNSGNIWNHSGAGGVYINSAIARP